MTSTPLDLTRFQALSFDCYGTLIDWEAGIGSVLSEWAAEQGLDARPPRICCSRTPTTRRPSSSRPRRPCTRRFSPSRSGGPARDLGKPVSDAWAARLGASVPDWPAFPDSAEPSPGWAALPADHRVQRPPGRVRRQQPAPAGRLRGHHHRRGRRAYKPADNHFRALDATLPELGVARERAAARRSEPVPRPRAGQARGTAIGVDQPSSRSARLGATPEPSDAWTYFAGVHVHGCLRRRRRRRLPIPIDHHQRSMRKQGSIR